MKISPPGSSLLRVTPLLLALLWLPAAAQAGDMHRYPAGPGTVSVADIVPRADAKANKGEWYNEQYSISMKLEGNNSSYLQLIISNLGVGDGKLGVVWELRIGDEPKLKSKREFPRDQWKSDNSRFDVRIGNTGNIRWHGKPGDLTVDVESKDGYKARYRIKNLVRPWKPGSGRLKLPGGGYYEFQLVAPMARVQVTGTRPDGTPFELKGRAYVDHSRTNVASHKIATRWARFRAFAGKQTIHFVELFPPAHVSSRSVGFLLVANKKDGILFEALEAHGMYTDSFTDKKHPNRYFVPRKAKFEAQSEHGLIRVVTSTVRRVWREDYLKGLGRVTKSVVQKFAQPVGYGFDSKAIGIIVKPDGTKLKIRGIGRYIVTHVSKTK